MRKECQKINGLWVNQHLSVAKNEDRGIYEFLENH